LISIVGVKFDSHTIRLEYVFCNRELHGDSFPSPSIPVQYFFPVCAFVVNYDICIVVTHDFFMLLLVAIVVVHVNVFLLRLKLLVLFVSVMLKLFFGCVRYVTVVNVVVVVVVISTEEEAL